MRMLGSPSAGPSVVLSGSHCRAIPPPETVSDELRQFLEKGKPQLDLPYPTTNEGWLEWVRSEAEPERRIEHLLRKTSCSLTEREINGVNCFLIVPSDAEASLAECLLMHLHEGGYVLGGGRGGTGEAIMIAAASGLQVVAVDYRMPPQFPFPAAIDDALGVWRHLTIKNDPRRSAVTGTSAGGALALALVQRAIAEGLPVPGALAVGSPWSDLSKTGDSYLVNAMGTERYEGLLEHMAKLYANGHDLKDPRLSPVYGSFAGFPPTVLTSGTRDLFLSNTVRVDRKLREAAVTTRLQVLEGHCHAAYLNPDLPESKWVFDQIAEFLHEHLARTSTVTADLRSTMGEN